MTFPDGPEIELPSGDVTEGVVRIGDTVRRPHQATSPLVADYLAHLERAGFDGSPRYLGRDAQGRDVLTYLDGDVAGDPVEAWARDDAVLPGVARLLRRLHDASEGFTPPVRRLEPGRPEPTFPVGQPLLVTQRDLTPQNTVFRAGRAWGVIDFDLSDWTTRPTDLVNTAMHWVPLSAPADRPPLSDVEVFTRFRAMYDAYGRDHFDVAALLDAADLRFGGTYATMKWRADTYGGGWQRMWDDGLGELLQRRDAWFAEVRPALHAALR